MKIYLAYIQYDPEFHTLVSIHKSHDTAEDAAQRAEKERWEIERQIWGENSEEFKWVNITHWVSERELLE